MPETMKSKMNVIAGALFALLALLELGEFARALGFSALFAVLAILLCGTYAFLTVCLFMKRRDQLMLIALGALCLLNLVLLFLVFRSPLFILRNLFYVAAAAALLVLLLSQSNSALSSYKDMAKRFWFLPAALYAAAIIISFFVTLFYSRGAPVGYMLSNLASTIFFVPIFTAAGYLFLGSWLTSAETESGKDEFAVAGGSTDAPGYNPSAGSSGSAQRANQSGDAPRPVPTGDGFISLLMHVVLLVFTGGIWYMIWIYRTTGYLNRVQGEPYRDPLKKLLLCFFVPFYLIYWVYQSARRVDLLAAERGVYSDLTTFCLVLAFFVGIMPPAFMQEKINTISMVESGYNPQPGNNTAPTTAPSAPNAANGTSVNVAEEIKVYKDLLDSGAITQEDYDAKKRSLLGV